MLGRLRMTIPQCIAAYQELAKEVFDVNVLSQAANMLKAHRFSGQDLKTAVNSVVDKHCARSGTKMRDDPEKRFGKKICRT